LRRKINGKTTAKVECRNPLKWSVPHRVEVRCCIDFWRIIQTTEVTALNGSKLAQTHPLRKPVEKLFKNIKSALQIFVEPILFHPAENLCKSCSLRERGLSI